MLKLEDLQRAVWDRSERDRGHRGASRRGVRCEDGAGGEGERRDDEVLDGGVRGGVR